MSASRVDSRYQGATSTGRRNTRLKSSCLVFSPEGFADVSEGLAQQALAMIE